jgi:deazaflavin-dependent oxidoreductase (nitroreductase family)
MLGQLAVIVLVAVAGVASLGVVYFLGMRAKWPIVQGPIIWLCKHVINPRQLRSAGTPGAYASVIRSVGRKSGRAYQTPVGAVAAGDDFVIALPYGTRPNWLQNAIAAGSATIVHEGREHAVDRPEVVPMAEVEAFFPVAEQGSHRRFGVDQCLRLRRAEAEAGARAAVAA